VRGHVTTTVSSNLRVSQMTPGFGLSPERCAQVRGGLRPVFEPSELYSVQFLCYSYMGLLCNMTYFSPGAYAGRPASGHRIG